MNTAMDAQTIMGVTIVFLIINMSLLLVGVLIKKFNLTDIIIGYNPKKDERIKHELSKLVGNSFIFGGMISYLGEAIYFLCRHKISPVFYVIYFLINIIGILINIYTRWYKLRKQ